MPGIFISIGWNRVFYLCRQSPIQSIKIYSTFFCMLTTHGVCITPKFVNACHPKKNVAYHSENRNKSLLQHWCWPLWLCVRYHEKLAEKVSAVTFDITPTFVPVLDVETAKVGFKDNVTFLYWLWTWHTMNLTDFVTLLGLRITNWSSLLGNVRRCGSSAESSTVLTVLVFSAETMHKVIRSGIIRWCILYQFQKQKNQQSVYDILDKSSRSFDISFFHFQH